MSGLRPSKDDDRRSSFHMGCTILKSRKLMKAVKYEGIGACDSGINLNALCQCLHMGVGPMLF